MLQDFRAFSLALLHYFYQWRDHLQEKPQNPNRKSRDSSPPQYPHPTHLRYWGFLADLHRSCSVSQLNCPNNITSCSSRFRTLLVVRIYDYYFGKVDEKSTLSRIALRWWSQTMSMLEVTVPNLAHYWHLTFDSFTSNLYLF